MTRMKPTALIAAGFLAMASIATALVLVASNRTVQGTPVPVAVIEPTAFKANITMVVNGYSRCEAGGYSDIRDGAQVEIVNEKNEVLAVGTLNRISTAKCEFSSVVGNVPLGEKRYGVKVGNANRGVIWKTETEAQTMGWALEIGR